MIKIEKFGCWVKVQDSTIFSVAMLADGSPETDANEINWSEVTEPTPGFLEEVADQIQLKD